LVEIRLWSYLQIVNFLNFLEI